MYMSKLLKSRHYCLRCGSHTFPNPNSPDALTFRNAILAREREHEFKRSIYLSARLSVCVDIREHYFFPRSRFRCDRHFTTNTKTQKNRGIKKICPRSPDKVPDIRPV